MSEKKTIHNKFRLSFLKKLREQGTHVSSVVRDQEREKKEIRLTVHTVKLFERSVCWRL